MGPRNLVADAISYFKFAEFTLTVEDAKEYIYSLSTKRRVYNPNDIEADSISDNKLLIGKSVGSFSRYLDCKLRI